MSRFSIDLLKAVHPRGRSTFANVTRVATPDARTAVIELSKPAPYLLKALSAGESPIVPKHLYASGDPLSNPHNNAPIGTGPYPLQIVDARRQYRLRTQSGLLGRRASRISTAWCSR